MLLICFGKNSVTTLINGEQDFVETAVYVLCMLQIFIIFLLFPSQLSHNCVSPYTQKNSSVYFLLLSAFFLWWKREESDNSNRNKTYTNRQTHTKACSYTWSHTQIHPDRQKYIDSHKYIHQVTHRYTQTPPPQTHTKTQQFIEKHIETYTEREKDIDIHRHTMTNLGTHREVAVKEKILKDLVKRVAFT